MIVQKLHKEIKIHNNNNNKFQIHGFVATAILKIQLQMKYV